MIPPTIDLRIVTPAGEFLHEPVEFVEMTTTIGQVGAMAGHTRRFFPNFSTARHTPETNL